MWFTGKRGQYLLHGERSGMGLRYHRAGISVDKKQMKNPMKIQAPEKRKITFGLSPPQIFIWF